MKPFKSIPAAPRIAALLQSLLSARPELEAERALLITEAYRQSESLPMVLRRSAALRHILQKLPITIRPGELIVGSNTRHPRSSQVFPEFSFRWILEELDTMEHRNADPFFVSEETKRILRQVLPEWEGKTTSELALRYMPENSVRAMEHHVFTPGNYYFNGIGHVTVDYVKVLKFGFRGILQEIRAALTALSGRRSAARQRRGRLQNPGQLRHRRSPPIR